MTDAEKMLAEGQAVINQTAQQPPTTGEGAAKIRINFGTAEQPNYFEFTSPEEAGARIQQWNAEIVAAKQREALEAARQTPLPPQPQGRMVTGEEEVSFDRSAFMQKFLDHKRAKEWADPALSDAIFDGKVPNATAVIREAVIAAARNEQELQKVRFQMAHHEFADSPENWKVLGEVMQEMGAQQVTTQSLNAALQLAQSRGQLPTYHQWMRGNLEALNRVQSMDPGQPPGNVVPMRTPVGAPGTPRSGGSGQNNTLTKEQFDRLVDGMNFQQYREFITKPDIQEALKRMAG